MAAVLQVETLCVSYGAVEALKGISLELDEGDIVAVLGSNGAGKTTLLKSISRLLVPRSGSIRLRGSDINKFAPHQLIQQGIAHVPEGRKVFATLTVEENLRMGVFGVRTMAPGKEYKKTRDWIFQLFPRLLERRKQLAGTLSGGEQQMLAIGRGLISKPSLMLLDEPSLGLAPVIAQEIFRVIRQIHQDERVSILLVEQNARKALALARYGYILETGKIAIQGDACDLRNDERVKAAYLGGAKVNNPAC